jgi:NADH-quinone oxidoreductase subunit M
MIVELDFWFMSVVVFLPAAFALVLFFFPRGFEEAMRWWALFGAAATLGASLFLFVQFKNDTIDFYGVANDKEFRHNASLPSRAAAAEEAPVAAQPRSNDWVARFPWLGRFGVDYHLGADGINVPLVLLTTVLFFLGAVAGWRVDRFVRGYCVLFLALETGVLGTLLALDLFLFFAFWGATLLPAYFLLGVWGGPRRESAALKFVVFALLGAAPLLVAVAALHGTDVRDFVSQENVVAAEAFRIRQGDPSLTEEEAYRRVEVHTFDLMVLQRAGRAALDRLSGRPVTNWGLAAAKERLEQARRAGRPGEVAAAERRLADAEARLGQDFFQPWFQYTIFTLLFIGFASRLPVFPLHTWLPDTLAEAPTGVGMVLSGAFLTLGGYGLLRVALPVCPWAARELAWWLALLGVVNIVYGAFAAAAQTDFNKLLAYHSLSQMGYVVLGVAVFPAAAGNAGWWGVNGAEFQLVAHGLTAAGLFFLAGVLQDRAHHHNLDNFRGLYGPMPLYGGVGAVLFFAALGLPGLCGFVGEVMVFFGAWGFDRRLAAAAATATVLTGAYLIWTLQRVFMGQNPAHKNYPDISVREFTVAGALAVLCVALGVLPAQLLINWSEPSVTNLVETLAK